MYLAFTGAAVLRSTSAIRSKYPAFCFSMMTFFATEGRIMSLNTPIPHAHETFFLLLTNHHHYEIMKDAEKGKGPGILTLWLVVFFCLCLCSFSIRESMSADNGKGAWLFGFIQTFFVTLFFTQYFCVFVCVLYHSQSEGALLLAVKLKYHVS